MNAFEDARDLANEMVRHAAAGRHAEAMSSAREVLRLAHGVTNPRASDALLAAATQTWLVSAAVVDPSDATLVAKCDRTFGVFSKLSSEHARTTAIIALGVKLELLVKARQTVEVERASDQLAAFYSAQTNEAVLFDESEEIVRIASNVIGMGAPGAGAGLARLVADRLAGSANPQEALLAASAQAWVVVALQLSGLPLPPVPVAFSAEEFRALLDADDVPDLGETGEAISRLIAMGDSAIEAAEAIMLRLRFDGSALDPVRMLLLMITIATLKQLGRDDASRAAEAAFVDEFSDHSDWRTVEIVQWLGRDLERS